jgi:hypothetical protein
MKGCTLYNYLSFKQGHHENFGFKEKWYFYVNCARTCTGTCCTEEPVQQPKDQKDNFVDLKVHLKRIRLTIYHSRIGFEWTRYCHPGGHSKHLFS